MKVTVKKSDETTFYRIKIGEVFRSGLPTLKHDSGYFMKISSNELTDNAIDVSRGTIVWFSTSEHVVPVDAELVIKE